MDIFSELFFIAVIMVVCAFFIKPIRSLWVMFVDTYVLKATKEDGTSDKLLPLSERFWVSVIRELPSLVIASFLSGLLVSFGGHDVSYIFMTALMAWGMAAYLDNLSEPARKAIYVGTGIALCAIIVNLNPSNVENKQSFFEDEYAQFNLSEGSWNLTESIPGPCEKLLKMANMEKDRKKLFASATFRNMATACDNLDFASVTIKESTPDTKNSIFSPLMADE